MGIIYDALSGVTDWIGDSRHPFFTVLKGTAVAVGSTAIFGTASMAVVVAPFYLADVAKEKRFEHTLTELDKRPMQIFKNLGDCTAKGHTLSACEFSEYKASRATAKPETLSPLECNRVFGVCSKVISGEGDISGSQTTYSPFVAGWVAAKDDLTIAAPVYKTADPNVVYRKDLRAFNLNG